MSRKLMWLCICNSGIVFTSEKISMEPLFPCQGGHIRWVSIEWAQREPLYAK